MRDEVIVVQGERFKAHAREHLAKGCAGCDGAHSNKLCEALPMCGTSTVFKRVRE